MSKCEYIVLRLEALSNFFFSLKPSPYQNPKSFTMTPAALRARQPFFWKNMFTAGALMGLCAGICK